MFRLLLCVIPIAVAIAIAPTWILACTNKYFQFFMPTEYVDISDFIDLKLEMLECHESQLKWMRDHDHIDFAEFVKTCARYRGLQCGTQYAEGFQKCYAWPKVVPGNRLP